LLGHLLDGVLPVFAIGLVGYVLGRRNVFDFQMAMAINRFVMFAGMPALGFRLLARAPLEEFNLMMLGGYFATEIVMYLGGFAIGRYIFRVDVKEAALLGLAVALTNHVLFVLPIATELFGDSAVTPIVAIISMDGIFLFCGTIVLMDVLASKDATVGQTIGKIARNPPLVAMVLGLSAGTLGLPIPTGADVFLKLLADAAAPALLFALHSQSAAGTGPNIAAGNPYLLKAGCSSTFGMGNLLLVPRPCASHPNTGDDGCRGTVWGYGFHAGFELWRSC